jgi:hypothetical protein
MFIKSSYYMLTTRVLPGWPLPQGGHQLKNKVLRSAFGTKLPDAASWKEPSHLVLANLGYKPALRTGFASESEMLRFVKEYGPPGVSPADTGEPGDEFEISIHLFHWTQTQLREAWQKRDHRLFVDPEKFKSATGYEHMFRVNWDVRRGMLEMRLASWYDYVAILLTRDIAEKRARVCLNPECPAPYFIAGRRDAKFCSHGCASSISHKNYLKRRRRKNER